MKDMEAPILTSDANDSVMSDLSRRLSADGFCHVRCSSAEAVETVLLKAQTYFGDIIRHDRSLPNGLVPVRFKPEIDAEKRLISDTAGEAEAHMDGVFMPSPPGVIALGVVELRGEAPETYTIDFREVLGDLADDVILRHARKDAARMTRANKTTTFTPLAFQRRRVKVRYRFDNKVELLAEDGGKPLFQDIHRAIRKATTRLHGLSEGSILFMDNTRMLHGRAPFDPSNAQRLLLRAWYPADGLTLGVPWEGRDKRTASRFDNRRMLIRDGEIHVPEGPSSSRPSEALMFAIKQAIGFRHAPLAWEEAPGPIGLALRPVRPIVTDQTPLGACLDRDLDALLWAESELA